MATTRAANKDRVLTVAQLAEEMAITEAEALALMKRDDFPATQITGDSYVIDRGLLEMWVRENARRVEGINTGFGTIEDVFSRAVTPSVK